MKIRTWRRSVEWLFLLTYLLFPFIKIGGESALRFDVPTLKLHFFGTALWMQEFFLVLLAVVFFVALFLFLTLVLGRVWCGWVCPQTVLCDLSRFVEPKRNKSGFNTIAGHVLLMVVSLALGFATICYFVSPYEAIPKIAAWELGPVPAISTLVVAVLIYFNLAFLRRTFCATICPYAKIQSVLTDDKSLIIQLDPERADKCIECKMCVRSCPTGIDIRGGMQVSCIMCAECIDACNKVMAGKKKKGLIGYSFGIAGCRSLGELIRPGASAFALAGLFALTILIYQSGSRSQFDFSILPHPMEPRLTKEGDVMNAYILSIKNKSKEDLSLGFTLKEGEKETHFSHSITEDLLVPAGLVEKFPLFLRSRGNPGTDQKVTIVLENAANREQRPEKKVYFNIP